MWHVAKASVIGTSHKRMSLPCQDSHYVLQQGDTIIIAVSDGLGSAAHSEQGSALACTTAVEFISQTLAQTATRNDEHMCQQAFTAARNALVALATSQGKELRDFACTLVVAVITPTVWVIQHIGDGAVVGIYADGSVRTLSSPDNGEFINSTYPLTSNDYQTQMRFMSQHETLAGIAVVSDGVQPMCINYKTSAAFPGFFSPLTTWLSELKELSRADDILATMLDSSQFRLKSDDDMTLVLAIRVS